MPDADFLYLAVPGTPDTKNLISRERLNMLKPTCGIVNIGRKKLARESLGRLGSETLQQLLSDGLEKRIDDDKNMHIRISLSKLVKGEVRLCTRDRSEAFVKGLFKIESYPGDNHLEIITELVRSMT